MDLQIRPIENAYCFGLSVPECDTCAHRKTWERIRTTNRSDRPQYVAIDFNLCDLTPDTHRVEAAS
jgi:hypothetical protein